MTRKITGELFKQMINNASAAIENNKQEINDLNVFPVPDGDTGTNMSLTITAAQTALQNATPGTIGHTAEITAGALLRGARGNSGVILSLLFRGFSKSLKDVDEADSVQFSKALAAGVDSAYKAVMKPAEGTILTVSRLALETAVSVAETEPDIEKVLEAALKTGYTALDDTINQNPVLKKAGVIDAGAKGYLYMLDAMLMALRGEILQRTAPAETQKDKADFSQFASEDITFTYCTEFITARKNKKNVNQLRDFLDNRGDSVVVVDDDEVIKVHVHTNEPGVVITEALTYGPLISIKIENMREQHTEAISSGDTPQVPSGQAPQPPAELKQFGFVAVCAGEGMSTIFRDLGADGIITGGQTMNPSTEDILKKINATPAKTVFVLPNNKNIILAAEQCIGLTDKQVVVIPTRSLPQGVSAMLCADGVSDVDELRAQMSDAIKNVRTAEITTAARNSNFDGVKIKKGSYLALIDGILAASGYDFEAVLSLLAEALAETSPGFITVYSGEGVDGKETEIVTKILSNAIPGADVVSTDGGQPLYSFIISAE